MQGGVVAKKVLSRREFLGSALGSGCALALGIAGLGAGWTVLAAQERSKESSADYALIIDTTKCVGCGACRTACHIRNKLPEDVSYIHILSYGEGAERKFVPIQC